ncbi:MAG: RibD family protein [Brevefilum sp.]|nr:RibD family protein [Brevefilum sp.]MDT8381554.1 RibD family protein [Brevefilum sp.]
MMLPKVILHIGCSLDGRIDWLKPDNFIYYRVIQGWKVDAMISGSRTFLAAEMSDHPDIKKLSDQYLVVVDSKGRINNWEIIKRQAYWNDTPIVLCSDATPKAYVDRLNDLQIHSLIHGIDHVDLAAALEDLHEIFGIEVLRTDSGGILAGVLLRENLVDEVSIVYSPQLTGGQSPKSIFVAPDLKSFSEVIDLKLLEYQVIDDNYFHLRYKVI